MNPTKPKSTHPLFQNKSPQTEQSSAISKGGIVQTSDTPYYKESRPPSKSTDEREKYAKKKVQEAFRKALQVWHTNPKFQGKDYLVCKKVVSEMFNCDEDF